MKMSKNLKHHNDNTREVHFEKTEFYYTKKDEGTCLEQCMVHNDGTMIGSAACSDCIYNKGCHDIKNYIICRRLTKAITK